jgi:DNA-binding SARP family transcriptional activator
MTREEVVDPDSRLGAMVRAYRHEAGLTQEQLASRAGLSIATLRDIEQSRRRCPRGRSLAALVDAFDLDPVRAANLVSVARELRRAGGSTRAVPALPGGLDHRADGLWVSILGPLEAWRDRRSLPLGPPARRVVLSLLAMDPGALVRRDTMIDALWGDTPPRTAVGLLQSHISRLRQVLRRPGQPAGGDALIDLVGAAYRLRLSSDELDLLAFRGLAERGAEAMAAGDAVLAYELYDQAVRLWRSDPLSDLDPIAGHPGMTMLRQQLTNVLLRYADVACSLGRYRAAVERLLSVTAVEPLNEPVHARLMIALAGSGQQAQAISVYENLRSRLAGELGLYPSEEVVDAHLRVLRQDIVASRPGLTRR